ncbi:OLC1v1036071C1 [Oldenlandia corymbosa var. corymbosa]|uniref:OLC1v1036071C1 n=1 Tax=Oldenlandia corymbosa var. corymbosa TaxID=529605 RepID=A0AAV1CXM9_OLDCO|nr:OLC1v1036071C1 [Oldenlandia corymbosa var. corymbosa]
MVGISYSTSSSSTRTFASLFNKPYSSILKEAAPSTDQYPFPDFKKVSFFNSSSELEYDDEEFEALIASHKMTLVGKFSYGRPKMEEANLAESDKQPRSGSKRIQFAMPKPVPKWKPRPDSGKPEDHTKAQASTPGLSTMEKQSTPIDIDDSIQINEKVPEKITPSPTPADNPAKSISESDLTIVANEDASQL